MKKGNEYSLGEAIEAFLKNNNLKEKALIERVISDWEHIMGKPIADNTDKIWFNAGVFYVKMKSPVWKTEMMLAKSKVMEMVNRELGASLVREVKVM